MTLQPTPLRAALAGLFSALTWPLVWARFGGAAGTGQVELIVATLLLVALPAHLFVLGLGPGAGRAPGAGLLDRALLRRIGAWLAAAVGGLVLAQAFAPAAA